MNPSATPAPWSDNHLPARFPASERLCQGLAAAVLLACATPAPAPAATLEWVEGLGFRWVDERGHVTDEDCWNGKTGRPISCDLISDLSKFSGIPRPRPRPPCLTPVTPGCPVPPELAMRPRWPVVKHPLTPPQPPGNPGWFPPVVFPDDPGCCRSVDPDPTPPPVIPLPAPALLLLSALGLLWRFMKPRRKAT